jgi:hypothetical protein
MYNLYVTTITINLYANHGKRASQQKEIDFNREIKN